MGDHLLAGCRRSGLVLEWILVDDRQGAPDAACRYFEVVRCETPCRGGLGLLTSGVLGRLDYLCSANPLQYLSSFGGEAFGFLRQRFTIRFSAGTLTGWHEFCFC
jgi:hypothetical protein